MRPAKALFVAFLAICASCSACGLGPQGCGGGFFESCIQVDPAAMQEALKRPEAKLAFPGSDLVDQAAKGLTGVNTATGTEARVTRIFKLWPDATFAQAVHYYDDQLSAIGWQRAPEPETTTMHASVKPDNYIRWVLPAGQGGDFFILTSAELPAGEYRAQLNVGALDGQGHDDDSAYLQGKLDSPEVRGQEPSIKPSTAG